jgi:hypothetical protein
VTIVSDEEDVAKWKQKWTLRKVIQLKRRKEIDEEIGEPPGSKSYLQKYPGAVSTVMASVTDETKEYYMELAAKWNRAGPPKTIQRRCVMTLQMQPAL